MCKNVYAVMLCLSFAVLIEGLLSTNQSYVEQNDVFAVRYDGEDVCQFWMCGSSNTICFMNCIYVISGSCCEEIIDVKEDDVCSEIQIRYKETKIWSCMDTSNVEYQLELYEFSRTLLTFDNFNGSVLENTEIEIRCLAHSWNPEATRLDIVWAGSNTSCEVNASAKTCFVFITVNRSNNDDIISCFGNQLHYKDPSVLEVHLNVMYPPDKVTIQSDNTSTVGESISLKCVLDDHGNPSTLRYIWNVNFDEKNVSHRCNSTYGSEIMCDVSTVCTALFTCFASNSVGETSGSKNITIYDPMFKNQSYVETNDIVHIRYHGDGECLFWGCESYLCYAYCYNYISDKCCSEISGVSMENGLCTEMFINYTRTLHWSCSTGSIVYNVFLEEFVRSPVSFGTFNGSIVENSETEVSCAAGYGIPNTLRIDLVLNGIKVTSCTTTTNNTFCQLYLYLNSTYHNSTLECYGYQLAYKDLSSTQITLNIRYPPRNARIESENRVSMGESIILTCVLEDHGNPSLVLYYWNSTKEMHCNATEGRSIICVVLTACTVTFWCVAENSIGMTTATKAIELTENASIVIPLNNSKYDVCYSSMLSINCSAYGKPMPTVEWMIEEFSTMFSQNQIGSDEHTNCSYYVTQQLSWGMGSTEERKHLKNISILCEAANSESSSNVSVILNTEYPPGKSTIFISNTIVNVNSLASFNCTVSEEGNPKTLGYSIRHDSTTVCTAELGRVSALPIHNISQEGYYSCQAENYPASICANLGNWSDPINIIVHVPAEFVLIPKDVSPEYADPSFTLTCESIGKPSPHISLFKEGNVAGGFTQMSYVYTQTTKYGLQEIYGSNFTWTEFELHPTCETILAYDSNTYTCYIENPSADGGKNTNQSPAFSLRTKYQPIWNDSKSTEVLAEIYQENFEITCHMCAYPVLNDGNFTWLNDAKDIIPNEKHNVLVIRNVTQNSFSNVTCLASNGVGTATQQVIFILESGPPTVEGLRIMETTSFSITVEWKSHDGNNPPAYTYIYKRAIVDDTNSSFELYSSGVDNNTISNETITNLTCSAKYEILVVVENMYRKTNISQKSVIAVTRDFPNITFTGATLKDGRITANWIYHDAETRAAYLSYQVDIRVIYWDPRNDETLFRNPRVDEEAIHAVKQQHSFTDASVNDHFRVSIEIYENGIINCYINVDDVLIDAINTGNLEVILGSTFLVAGLSTMAILLFMHRTKIASHFNKEHNEAIEFETRPSVSSTEYDQSPNQYEQIADYANVVANKVGAEETHIYAKLDQVDSKSTCSFGTDDDTNIYQILNNEDCNPGTVDNELKAEYANIQGRNVYTNLGSIMSQ